MFFSGLIGSLASGSMTAVWLVLMVVLLIIEGAVPGLVSIWFALGAFAAMISAILRAGADKAACKEVCQLQGAADQRGHGDRQGVPCDGGY